MVSLFTLQKDAKMLKKLNCYNVLEDVKLSGS